MDTERRMVEIKEQIMALRKEVQELGEPRMTYNVKEAARMLSISESSIRKEINKGHIESHKMGKIHLITRAELERFTQQIIDGAFERLEA